MEELEGNEVSINVRSFGGATVVLKVSKKEGMEGVELLTEEVQKSGDSDSAQSGLWNTLSR